MICAFLSVCNLVSASTRVPIHGRHCVCGLQDLPSEIADRGEYVDMAVAFDHKSVALLTSKGYLWMGSADLTVSIVYTSHQCVLTSPLSFFMIAINVTIIICILLVTHSNASNLCDEYGSSKQIFRM